MSGDLVTLAQEVSPYVTAAVGAYGGAVLARANEEAADATVGWGRALLQRIFGVTSEQEVPEAVAELAADPDNEDLQAVLRVQIKKFLTADPELAAQVRAMLEQADVATGRTVTTTVTASGKGAIAAGRDITGSVTTGDQSPITPA
ncbi:hypothetical protein [Streptosporangium sp. LJ11]|uniref:hypothetical protein n=1 Tax=Streptosporangium sp. LJ11 TaxID=3436927 RepID=UPI003F796C21